MKKGFRFLLGCFAALALTVSMVGCGHDEWPDPESSSVLFYMVADNSLSIYAYDFMNQITRGYLPERNTGQCEVLVYCHMPNDNPRLMKLTRRKALLLRETEQGSKLDTIFVLDTLVIKMYPRETKSATPEVMHQVILDAEAIAPAARHGLVLWSHATGYLPSGYYLSPTDLAKPEKRSFGSEYSHPEEIDIPELAEALPFHYDFILFDCCLMGGVEVAYELRDKCDYIAFSPAEVMAQGFPYYVMLDAIWNGRTTEESMKSICQEFYHYYDSLYQRYKSGASYIQKGCTVSLVKTEKLEPLAAACRTVFENHRDEIYSLDYNLVQRYYRYNYHWFFDLGDIVEQVADADEFAAFQTALDNAVVYKAATPEFLKYSGGFDVTKYSGLSSYLPRPEYVNLNAFYFELAWNQATHLVE